MTISVLGLITARGGSRSVPKKNVSPLAGKPLVAWTIESALSAAKLSKVVVSTDDSEIAEVARRWGAEVPFMRPRDLARDDTPHIPVLINAVERLEKLGSWHYEYVMLLQPTSPLRTSKDIDCAIELALEKDADSVVSVCEAPSHPYLTKQIAVDGTLQDFVSRPDGYLRRQVLPPAYALNGAIYLVRLTVLLAQRTLLSDPTHAYVMSPERSLDIDTPWDFYLADLILRERIKREES